MDKSKSIIKTKKMNVEADRQDEIREFLQDDQQSLDQFIPGTFGCHELLDRTAMIVDLLERVVTTHPACIQNPEWYGLARQAGEALHKLYQQVGAVHLQNEDPSVFSPRILPKPNDISA